MHPRERELLTGMGNCFEACHEDFDGTIGMVASSRGRTPADVKETLLQMRAQYGSDPDYQRLRARVPADFPI
ncbi:MAG: alkaline phosphatase D family protein [Thermoplasmata archaeon]|nr:alkaline phosphatase D family protein [Thermoplasmata archaeon]